jgi:hypothetical protein
MGLAENMESPQCASCTWKDPEEYLCPAYPYGIPVDILQNRILHSEILPDQMGDSIYTAVKTFSK